MTSPAVEVLPVYAADGGLWWVHRRDGQSLRVAWDGTRTPHEAVIGGLAPLHLRPIVVHSTSWRFTPPQIVLTYLAVVHPPLVDLRRSLVTEPVPASALAYGSAHAAPEAVPLTSVLAHALRHLAWLLAEDPVVARGLPGWKHLLAGVVPAAAGELAPSRISA